MAGTRDIINETKTETEKGEWDSSIHHQGSDPSFFLLPSMSVRVSWCVAWNLAAAPDISKVVSTYSRHKKVCVSLCGCMEAKYLLDLVPLLPPARGRTSGSRF